MVNYEVVVYTSPRDKTRYLFSKTKDNDPDITTKYSMFSQFDTLRDFRRKLVVQLDNDSLLNSYIWFSPENSPFDKQSSHLKSKDNQTLVQYKKHTINIISWD